MQVTLKKSISNGSIDNVVVLCNSLSVLDNCPISTKEIKYIGDNLPSAGAKLYVFNRLEYFTMVCYYNSSDKALETHQTLRTEAKKLHGILVENNISEVSVVGSEGVSADDFLAYSEALILSSYTFDKYKTKKGSKLDNITLVSETIQQGDIDKLMNICSSVFACRDWVNEPIAELNAETFANVLQEHCNGLEIKTTVLNQQQIEALGMGGILAVNKGSQDEARFVVLEWKPGNAVNTQPIALVGKGIMYDTGGLNIKTGTYMNDMKSDMAGAATVAATMVAVAKNKLPISVVALLPLTDNRPNGNAYAAGDIIRMYDKTTVEVINTDAEGRMVLADAIAYAQNYNPQLIIDVATLTGAAQNAIGKVGMVGMHHDAEQEMAELKNSGEQVYERIAEFPFWSEYDEWIKSDVADLRNTSKVPNAGMITAGKFLAHFAKSPFIHLDIAGVAFYNDNSTMYGVGGTAFGVRLLYNYLKNKCEK